MMGAVFVYNPETMQRTNHLNTSADMLAFSPTQPLLAVGPYSFTIWNMDTGETTHLQQEGSPSGQMMFSAAFSSDGKLLATSVEGGLIELWDTNSWTKIRNMSYPKVPGGGNDVFHLVFTPDGNYLLSQIYHSIVFWDPAAGESLNATLSTAGMDINLSNDGQSIAFINENIISVWDISKVGHKIAVPFMKKLEFEGYSIFNESTTQIAFSHQDEILFAGSYNGDLGAWSLNPPKVIFLEKGYLYSIDCLALSPDGRTLLTASFDGTVILWGVTP
jgi:WD40 repeat protein